MPLDRVLGQLFDARGDRAVGWRGRGCRARSMPLLPLILLAGLVVITALAYAGPQDPTWIAGLYDAADYDDESVLLMGTYTHPSLAGEPGRPVAILSYGIWQTHFGGDQKIVGRALRLNGSETVVVGVAANDFDFPAGMQFWMPLAMSAEDWNRTSPGQLHMLGMLPPDVTESRAQSEATVIAARLEGEYPPTGRKLILQLLSFRVQVNGNLTPIFTMTLMGAAAFFLLIACTNLSNLLLARAAGRRKEVAIRSALGAGRARLMGQLLTESLVLSTCGALVGVGIAWLAVRYVAGPAFPPVRIFGHAARRTFVRRGSRHPKRPPEAERMLESGRGHFFFRTWFAETS